MSEPALASPPAELPEGHFLHCLGLLNAEYVKRAARFWAGRPGAGLSKGPAREAVARALTDQDRLRALQQELSPFQQAALWLLRLDGGMTPAVVLAGELLMYGLPWSGRGTSAYGYGSGLYEPVSSLATQGVLLRVGLNARYYSLDFGSAYYESGSDPRVFTDPRVLPFIRAVPPAPLELSPAEAGRHPQAKRPAEVGLRLVTLLETVRKLGPMDLTASGRPTKPYLNRLTRALGWDKVLAADPDAALPDATSFFLGLLRASGLVRSLPQGRQGFLRPEADELLRRPHGEQMAVWAAAYPRLTGWLETERPRDWWSPEEIHRPGRYNALRAALLVALAALPHPDAWYRIEDLSAAVFQRAGRRLSLGHMQPFYPTWNASPERQEQERAGHARTLEQKWRASELPWIRKALAGPLFHLGLIELGLIETGVEEDVPAREPSVFRLTHAGRVALYNRFRGIAEEPAPAEAVSAAAGPAWVVQANLDVVVYLERLAADRLSFMARVAERQPSEGGAALYRLTRDSIYQALESGVGLEVILRGLEEGAGQPLPDSAARTLRDWAARRERLLFHRAAHLMEYPDTAARDAALAAKEVYGEPVGDRFVLIGERRLSGPRLASFHLIDYREPPARCLQVTEDGVLTLQSGQSDLLIRTEVGHWAASEDQSGERWRITRESVQRAVRSGWSADEILQSLARRVPTAIPPLVRLAIRQWGRQRRGAPSLALGEVLVLQASDEVAQAIGGSPLLKPYLRGRLGPRTFLVDASQAGELRALLEAFGLEPAGDPGEWSEPLR
jgi:XPB/Ssl2-like helicase family protein